MSPKNESQNDYRLAEAQIEAAKMGACQQIIAIAEAHGLRTLVQEANRLLVVMVVQKMAELRPTDSA